MDEVAEVRALKAAAFDWLEGKDPVLDAGCGIGTDIAEYRSHRSVTVTGLDSFAALVAEARRRFDGEFVLGSLDDLPFQANIFGGATLVRVLHHLDSPATALRELHRVLVADGRLVVAELGLHLMGSVERDPDGFEHWRQGFEGSDAPARLERFIPALLAQAGFGDCRVYSDERGVRNADDVLACLAVPADIEDPVLSRWARRLSADVAAGDRWLRLSATYFVASA